jgi:phosphate transport system permease protein
LAMMLSLVFLLLAVVVSQGCGVFWPSAVARVELSDGSTLLGENIRSERNPDTREISTQFKTGNREQDSQRQDFHWVKESAVRNTSYPGDVCVLERLENGNFYGFVKEIQGPDVKARRDEVSAADMSAAIEAVRHKMADDVAPISAELVVLGKRLQAARDALAQSHYRRQKGDAAKASGVRNDEAAEVLPKEKEFEASIESLRKQSDYLVAQQQQRVADLRRNGFVLGNAAGGLETVAVADIVRFYRPNAMSLAAKCKYYFVRLGELLWDNPRESNTEGGLFPAIFGTVLLIFLMAATCFPLGVLAGVYLGEYAKEGLLVRIVRIAVNNLAGIPSIVYGIFGLGFFVYGIGGMLDRWLFPERVAAGTPTFGTGGILWASMTLGLLTVPVVIVSTEEALRAIPRSMREGSLALGATKFQTLLRVLLPMASPGMMTGFILAMARAAGEVAPLMITGVVKLAPQLPMDATFPFFHLDRKFMHLGFHIYDVGFQSPNVEASKPMVFVTTLLLLLIVLAMTGTAIYQRNRMRKRYQVRTI